MFRITIENIKKSISFARQGRADFYCDDDEHAISFCENQFVYEGACRLLLRSMLHDCEKWKPNNSAPFEKLVEVWNNRPEDTRDIRWWSWYKDLEQAVSVIIAQKACHSGRTTKHMA